MEKEKKFIEFYKTEMTKQDKKWEEKEQKETVIEKDLNVIKGEIVKIETDKTLSEISKQQKEFEKNNKLENIFKDSYDNSLKAVKGIDDIKNSIDENKELVNKNNELVNRNNELLEKMIKNQVVLDKNNQKEHSEIIESNKKIFNEITNIKKLIGNDDTEKPETLFKKLSKLGQDHVQIRKNDKKIHETITKNNKETSEKIETIIENDEEIVNKISENKTDIETVSEKLLGLVDYIKKPFYKKFF